MALGDEFEEIHFTCMDCGQQCDIWEEVKIASDEYNIWCYCKKCDCETFHPITYTKKK